MYRHVVGKVARRLAFLSRVSIGDVRQTDDARERVVLGLYDNFR